jgi:REP element-mobilizing transposase RayT
VDHKRHTRQILDAYSDLMKDLKVPPKETPEKKEKSPRTIQFDFDLGEHLIQDRRKSEKRKPDLTLDPDKNRDRTAGKEVPPGTRAVPEVPEKQPRKIIQLDSLDPITHYYHHLSYICVLVPRLEEHQLKGAIGDDLRHWLKQLCLAFGWRLTQLDLNPGYLQWVMIASPGVAPATLIKKIQEHTSRRLFQSYPHLEDQNPSGEFWAVGCVLISGRKLLPDALINKIISNIRIQQGF